MRVRLAAMALRNVTMAAAQRWDLDAASTATATTRLLSAGTGMRPVCRRTVNGKVVVADTTAVNNSTLIARFNTDGSLIPGSVLRVPASSSPPGGNHFGWINRRRWRGSGLKADNRIVVTSSPDGVDMGVMVFTADGVLDTTFDGDGRKLPRERGDSMSGHRRSPSHQTATSLWWAQTLMVHSPIK